MEMAGKEQADSHVDKEHRLPFRLKIITFKFPATVLLMPNMLNFVNFPMLPPALTSNSKDCS